MTKVSVIVPVYNVELYIEDCLASLVNQTYGSFDVLFVDDCGKDASIQIIEKFLDSHPDFNARIIHHENNKGLSGARNTGLKEASGEYVYFFDSDDKIPCDALEKLMRPLQKYDVDFVVGDYGVFGDVQMDTDLTLCEGVVENVLQTYSEGKWYVMAWNKLCKRSFLLDNGLWFKEGYIHEDQIWSFMVACTARSMYVVPDVTYNYRVRASSIMTGMGVCKDALTYVKVYDVLHDYVEAHCLSTNPYVYQLYEGKRSGILYSLLAKNEREVYRDTYDSFYEQHIISPILAYRQGYIGIKLLARDIHYVLPRSLGRCYKKLFYQLYYKTLGKTVEGLVWK